MNLEDQIWNEEAHVASAAYELGPGCRLPSHVKTECPGCSRGITQSQLGAKRSRPGPENDRSTMRSRLGLRSPVERSACPERGKKMQQWQLNAGGPQRDGSIFHSVASQQSRRSSARSIRFMQTFSANRCACWQRAGLSASAFPMPRDRCSSMSAATATDGSKSANSIPNGAIRRCIA